MYRARYRRIVLFFARLLLSFAFWDLLIPRLGLRGWANQTRSERLTKAAVAFRSLAIQMGGVMIKVGQFLSSRVDVLPMEVTQELSGLQDEVPPAKFDDVRRVAEADLGEPLESKFIRFESKPLAAASLGQAHLARIRPLAKPEDSIDHNSSLDLPDQYPEPSNFNAGMDVVVKIQRPDIENLIATDLAALRTVGKWLRRYRPISRRADIPALLAEFARILYEEIDYLAEGRNAETFAVNFKDNPGVKVPKVIWTHTTKHVLTLENVWAIKITDYDAITAAGIDRAEVASRLLDTYLQQIFEDGFFHADPHPGNLFVQPAASPAPSSSAPKTPWQLTFIDFGMVGHVPPNLRDGLREMLIGVGTQDPARVVRSYQILGVLLPSADLTLLEKAEAKAFERFWGKNMTELTSISITEIREFTDEFRELIYSLPFQVPQNIIFLARAVGILSGMCTGLDPHFNIWDHLAPYAQKLIAEEARTTAVNWLGEVGNLVRSLVAVPRKMDSILSKMEMGEIAVRAPEVTQQVNRLQRAIRQVAGALIFTALLLGGIQLFLAGQLVFGEILLAGAAASLVWVIVAGRR